MNNYAKQICDQLYKLTAIASPSGYTAKAAKYVKETLDNMGYEARITRKGNVECTIGGEGNPLVLAAHVDTLGAMVRSIKANGRLKPTTLGGHQWSTADGENCMVFTRSGKMYTGVVLNKEPSAHVADQKVETKEENMEILLDENVDNTNYVCGEMENGDTIKIVFNRMVDWSQVETLVANDVEISVQ